MEFTHIREPHGTLHLKDCVATPISVESHGNTETVRYCAEHGLYEIRGTVKSGVTVNRLFHITSNTDQTGKAHSIWAVSAKELAEGYKRTIAM